MMQFSVTVTSLWKRKRSIDRRSSLDDEFGEEAQLRGKALESLIKAQKQQIYASRTNEAKWEVQFLRDQEVRGRKGGNGGLLMSQSQPISEAEQGNRSWILQSDREPPPKESKTSTFEKLTWKQNVVDSPSSTVDKDFEMVLGAVEDDKMASRATTHDSEKLRSEIATLRHHLQKIRKLFEAELEEAHLCGKPLEKIQGPEETDSLLRHQDKRSRMGKKVKTEWSGMGKPDPSQFGDYESMAKSFMPASALADLIIDSTGYLFIASPAKGDKEQLLMAIKLKMSLS
uniref:RPAP1_N domain-containing protein n=1 Tax=Caenorhabditis tropicalis TaxID=1561998 RepID=A0A1I7TJJ8_9PELO